jgi:hypothetical protein
MSAKSHVSKIALHAWRNAKPSALIVSAQKTAKRFAFCVLNHAKLVVNIQSAPKNVQSLAIISNAIYHALYFYHVSILV